MLRCGGEGIVTYFVKYVLIFAPSFHGETDGVSDGASGGFYDIRLFVRCLLLFAVAASIFHAAP